VSLAAVAGVVFAVGPGAAAAGRPQAQKAGAARPAYRLARVFTAPWPAAPVIAARYRYYPGAAPGTWANPIPDCATTGENCTTEQLCALWGKC